MAKQLRILDEAENIEAEHFAGAPRNQTESHCMILMLVIAEHVEVRNGCIRQGYCKQCSVLFTFKTCLMSMSYWPKLRGSLKFPGSLLESSKLCASCAQVVHKTHKCFEARQIFLCFVAQANSLARSFSVWLSSQATQESPRSTKPTPTLGRSNEAMQPF